MVDSMCPEPVILSKPASIIQMKIRLLGISPMIWRRLLIPDTCTLREFHGIIQVAMGWEGYHLFEFIIRGVHYSSPELFGESTDYLLGHFTFRKNAKLTYIYDMGDYWKHEIRIEDPQSTVKRQFYPVCIGGSGACPPEDCGGPQGYLFHRDEAYGLDAIQDITTIVDFIDEVVIQNQPDLLKDDDKRWEIQTVLDRCLERDAYINNRFLRGEVNKRLGKKEHLELMNQSF